MGKQFIESKDPSSTIENEFWEKIWSNEKEHNMEAQ